MEERMSGKSGEVCLLLAIFLGGLGIHRFYVGKIGTGILMLITGGGFYLWWLIDIFLIAMGKFTDYGGRIVKLRLSEFMRIFKKTLVFGIASTLFILVVFAIFCVYVSKNKDKDNSFLINYPFFGIRLGEVLDPKFYWCELPSGYKLISPFDLKIGIAELSTPNKDIDKFTVSLYENKIDSVIIKLKGSELIDLSTISEAFEKKHNIITKKTIDGSVMYSAEIEGKLVTALFVEDSSSWHSDLTLSFRHDELERMKADKKKREAEDRKRQEREDAIQKAEKNL